MTKEERIVSMARRAVVKWNDENHRPPLAQDVIELMVKFAETIGGSDCTLFSYHIETKSENINLNFFTQATDHKMALYNLQTNSLDYRNLVKSDEDFTISIKRV